MKSKEALEKLYEEREYLLGEKVNHKTKNWHNDIKHYDNINKCLLTIKQDLDRLEELEKENQELKRKYENRDYLYQNEVSKNGNLAGKIFEKDLKIQKLEKALEIIKNKGIDYHSISAIKQSKDYEDYLDLVKNLITVVFKFTKQEYELLKEVFCND